MQTKGLRPSSGEERDPLDEFMAEYGVAHHQSEDEFGLGISQEA